MESTCVAWDWRNHTTTHPTNEPAIMEPDPGSTLAEPRWPLLYEDGSVWTKPRLL